MDVLMDHIVLNVTNVEEEVEFYASLFGFIPERLELYHEGKVPFPSVRINSDTIIDLFPRKMWDRKYHGEKTEPNLNHFCLSISREDFERLCERLVELDVAIEQGPVERWGAHGTGVSIYFSDPEQNLIEIRYYERKNESSGCLLET
ncbi:MAG: Glyoxalase/bleomycin resistance protein/dioxygenase [Geobacteraceae bacterium]|nr:Glyoxalase/bleomycin resistance protein/dioxygenase [Geobacteraceae bacterium]